MIKEKLELQVKGKLAFKYNDGSKIEYKNAIQLPAKEIVAKALIQNASAIIDVIELYNLGVLISSRPISVRSIIDPTTVEFDAVFEPASFNSHIDEARLKASVIGYFSIVVAIIDITKDNTQSIMTSWTIQIV